MWRGKADALQSFNLMHRLEQLDEGRNLAGRDALPRVLAEQQLGPTIVSETTPPITRHDLSKQCDFPYTAAHELTTFGGDVGNRPAALFTTCVRYDAEGAILVAALHDADKRG